MDELSDLSNGVLDLTCRFVCNEAGMQSMRVCLVVGRPVRRAHLKHFEDSLKPETGIEWWASQAVGEWEQVCLERWQTITTEGVSPRDRVLV